MEANIRDLLAERREPAIGFRRVEKAHSKSRLGGMPSLPQSVDWPVHRDTQRPLHFMAQFDLAALPETPLPGCPFDAALPRQGMLFFFSFAESWDDDLSAVDIKGKAKHTRVIHTSTAGADRAAPEKLSMMFLNPDPLGGDAREEKLIPEQHLRACAIDTFWAPPSFDAQGAIVRPFKNDEDTEAKFQSIASAAGEAAPRMSGLQMFGAESIWEVASERPVRDRSRVLLLEFPCDAYDLGALQFWIETQDLKAQRFDRVIGIPCDS